MTRELSCCFPPSRSRVLDGLAKRSNFRGQVCRLFFSFVKRLPLRALINHQEPPYRFRKFDHEGERWGASVVVRLAEVSGWSEVIRTPNFGFCRLDSAAD